MTRRILLACLLALCLSSAANAAPPNFDAAASASAGGGGISSVSVNHTVGASCGSSIVIAAPVYYTQDTTISSVATSFTQIASTAIQFEHAPGNFWQAELYRRLGLTGTHAVQANFTDAVTGAILATVSYCNTHQTTPLGTAVAEADNSVTVSSAATETVFGINVGRNNATAGCVGTQRFSAPDAFTEAFSGFDLTGSASTVVSCTANSSFDLTIGVPLKPIATGVRRRVMF